MSPRTAAKIDFPALFKGHQPKPVRFSAMSVTWQGSAIHMLRPRGWIEVDALNSFLDVTSKVGVESGWFHLEQVTLFGSPGISEHFSAQCESLVNHLEASGIFDPAEITVTLHGDVAFDHGDDEDDGYDPD